jgi:hypothetical protein
MSLKTSITKNTRQSKFKRLSGGLAVNIAKQRNDPDVKKLQRFKKMFRMFKDKISKKYASRAQMAARKSIM